MPNSFESYYGHIRYWISGEVRPKHKARTANDLYEKLTDDFEVSIISPPNVPIAEQLVSWIPPFYLF